MTPLSIIAAIVGVFSALSGVPQAIKIYKRRSVKDISAITYYIVVVAAVVWIFYGIELNNFAIVLPNILAMITAVIILIEYYFYGSREKRH